MSEVICKNHGMTIPTYIPQKAHELPIRARRDVCIPYLTATEYPMSKQMSNIMCLHLKTSM